MILGLLIGDRGFGIGVGIVDWGWSQGLRSEFGIWDWDSGWGYWGWDLGSGLGYWGWDLGLEIGKGLWIGIGDWRLGFGIRIENWNGDLIGQFLRYW